MLFPFFSQPCTLKLSPTSAEKPPAFFSLWKNGKTTSSSHMDELLAKREKEVQGCPSTLPYPFRNSMLQVIREPHADKGKTHTWYVGHRTIVHWHLKHCALVIEQLFVCH